MNGNHQFRGGRDGDKDECGLGMRALLRKVNDLGALVGATAAVSGSTADGLGGGRDKGSSRALKGSRSWVRCDDAASEASVVSR